MAFLPKCARKSAARAPAAHLRWGAAAPQRGRVGTPGGGVCRISDITGGPRNPALTRVITGPNGPPDIYMISLLTVLSRRYFRHPNAELR